MIVVDEASTLDEGVWQQSVSLATQIACAEREVAMRRRVYPSWTEKGRMTQAKAEVG